MLAPPKSVQSCDKNGIVHLFRCSKNQTEGYTKNDYLKNTIPYIIVTRSGSSNEKLFNNIHNTKLQSNIIQTILI